MQRIADEKLLEPGPQPLLLDDPVHPHVPPPPPHVPTRSRIIWIALLLLTLVAVLFLVGYLPRHKRQQGIDQEARNEENSLPEVNVARVKQALSTSQLLLPGNMSPLNEAYIFARAAGYIRKRYVDIGDHVVKGQIMADIEEPDLDQQVIQAQAGVAQAQGALGQTRASLEQSQAQLRLQEATVRRIKTLVTRGVLSQQQGDQAQADYENAVALVGVAQSNVRAAESNVRAAEANLNRLTELQGYEKIRAPFTGVVTARSIDAGTLVAANGAGQGNPNLGSTASSPGGSSELFRVAQVGTLRMLMNVPQAYAPDIHKGSLADVILQGSNRRYTGTVTRTAASIDQTTRTMLTEVQVQNKDGSLLPGMYANVQFRTERPNPPLLVPGDSLVVRTKGPMVAVLVDGNKVHYEPVTVGRDYGTDLEITGGLKADDRVIINPSDEVREGAEVKPASSKQKAAGSGAGAQAPGGGAGQPGGKSDQNGSGIGTAGAGSRTQAENPGLPGNMRRFVCFILLATAPGYGLAQDAPTPNPPGDRPASESQSPFIGGNIVGPWYQRLGNPYHARAVAPVDFRNASRFSSLIRGGNLYLSLNDALALALENNLDIEVQRFTRPTAETDLLRAQGGGLTRGILYDIRQLPAGVGGPGSPLLTTVAGTTPITTTPTNTADLAPVTQTDTVLGISGTIPFSAGTPIPQYDPVLAASPNYSHQNTPETSTVLSGTSTLTSNSVGTNAIFTQGFSTGASLNVGFNTSRLSTNSARSLYNPYNAGSLGAIFTQPLLQGFSISNNRRFITVSKNEAKISDELFKQQLLDTLAAVIRLYWDLVSLNQDVRVKQQALELSRKLYEDNQAQVEVGTLAPIEVKRAQAEVARSQEDLTNSTGLVLQQELILKTVLTRRGTLDPVVGTARIIPSDVIQIPTQEPVQQLDQLLEQAYRARPDLAQARLQVENAHILLKGSKNALLPRLDLVGSFQNNALAGDANTAVAAGSPLPDPALVGGYGTFLSQVFGYKYPNYSVGVNLVIPLRNRVAQADYIRDQIIERQTEVRRQQQENQVRLEVEYTLQNLQRARASYDAAVQTRQLQEEALAAEQQRYQVGASTTYLVIQEQRDLAQARTTEVVTEGNYAKARAALERAIGQTLDSYGISIDEAYRGQVSKAPSPPPAQ